MNEEFKKNDKLVYKCHDEITGTTLINRVEVIRRDGDDVYCSYNGEDMPRPCPSSALSRPIAGVATVSYG
jgi:glutathione synthase/RimK-type ligase-like ATP-grasp enzyme